MPVSIDHESLVALFRNNPMLGAALLGRVGLDVGALSADLSSADLSELRPIERRADVVALLRRCARRSCCWW